MMRFSGFFQRLKGYVTRQYETQFRGEKQNREDAVTIKCREWQQTKYMHVVEPILGARCLQENDKSGDTHTHTHVHTRCFRISTDNHAHSLGGARGTKKFGVLLHQDLVCSIAMEIPSHSALRGDPHALIMTHTHISYIKRS